MSNLKELFKIQNALKKAGYFDVSRISNEIYTYSVDKNIDIEDVLKEIESGKPWEYVLGITEFCGNEIFVTEDTLIPRIETEQLVDIALDLLDGNIDLKRVVDIGCGSGCIAISIAKKRENLQCLATDVSKKALDVAKKNVKHHGLEEIIELKEVDLIDSLDVLVGSLIVANLPYVPTDMYENLDCSVKDFEPRIALDGKEDGLFYYKELIKKIEKSGKKNIYLLIEIEPSTLPILKKNYKQTEKVFKDFREKDRFVLFHFS